MCTYNVTENGTQAKIESIKNYYNILFEIDGTEKYYLDLNSYTK